MWILKEIWIHISKLWIKIKLGIPNVLTKFPFTLWIIYIDIF